MVDPPIVERLAERYRLREVIGRGGMGTVYAAVDERTGTEVAIKRLRPGRREDSPSAQRFLAEARTAARLKHPNVVAVLDEGEWEGTPFIVFERLRGRSLRARLELGPMSFEEISAILLPVLDALAAAHAQGLVHRDLKPANIQLDEVLDDSGSARVVPKVLDFGLAKSMAAPGGGQGDWELETAAGTVVGTPAYMAPERATGSREIGPWTDLWSVGVILYQALSGCLPFDFDPRGSATAALLAVATGAPQPIGARVAEVPEELARLLAECLRIEPAERIGSAAELARRIGALRGRVGTLRPLTDPPPAPGEGAFEDITVDDLRTFGAELNDSLTDLAAPAYLVRSGAGAGSADPADRADPLAARDFSDDLSVGPPMFRDTTVVDRRPEPGVERPWRGYLVAILLLLALVFLAIRWVVS